MRCLSACEIDGKLYFVSGNIVGLYCYDIQEQELTYISKYIEKPVAQSNRIGKVYSYGKEIFLFPLDGNVIEVFDIEKESIIWSHEIDIEEKVTSAVENKNSFFFVLYNSSTDLFKLLELDKTTKNIHEWESISAMMNEYHGEAYINSLVCNEDILFVGCGEKSEYFVIDLFTKDICNCMLLNGAACAYTLSQYSEGICIVTTEGNIVYSELREKRVAETLYLNVNEEKRLFFTFCVEKQIYGICHYDSNLYKIFLNNQEGTFEMEMVGVLDETSQQYPYWEAKTYNGSIFLLSKSDNIFEYRIIDNNVNVIQHKLNFAEEHLKMYIDNCKNKSEVIYEDNSSMNLTSFFGCI